MIFPEVVCRCGEGVPLPIWNCSPGNCESEICSAGNCENLRSEDMEREVKLGSLQNVVDFNL